MPRPGEDGWFYTADDITTFTSIDEVDDVPFVGSVALVALLSWARQHAWIEERTGDRDAGGGEACVDTSRCVDGLHCVGIPTDGSSPYGRCVDPRPVAAEGDPCAQLEPCGGSTICAGWTLFGYGACVPAWMARHVEGGPATPIPIPDASPFDASSSVIVEGLASVTADLEVVIHVEHPRPTDLRVTLTDPNGTVAVLWDRRAELEEWSRSFVPNGIARGEAVNGRWTLRIEDVVSGEIGVFHSWSLFVVSRWD